MANDEGAGAGARLTPGLVACGAGIVAWLVLARRVRALERRVDDVARKAELARRTADRDRQTFAASDTASVAVAAGACQVATAAAEVAHLQTARAAVRELICQAEAAWRAYESDVPHE